MHSCNCRPRQTLADRINAIIAKYETCPCSIPSERPRHSSLPKILSNSCVRGSTCHPSPSPCTSCLPCPVITPSSCCPQQTINTKPSPGPGLRRYISRRELCPALRGCLSLYKHPSPVHCTSNAQQSCGRLTCSPAPRCNPSISCPRSRPNCAVVTLNSQPVLSARSQKNCGPCAPCKPPVKIPQCSSCPQSIATSCCLRSESCIRRQRICRPCSPPRCTPCNSCDMRSRSATPDCCSCGPSSEMSSSVPGNCGTFDSSRPGRRRLTVFDDPPYTSNILEREFSGRFIRLDPCYCETDSSSSLENSCLGNKYR